MNTAFANGDYRPDGNGLPATASIWVSRIDGSGMHCLGSVPIKPDDPAYKQPGEIRWVPGEKRISFLYHDTLYAIPAD